jgi:hypothetical protein
MRIEVAKRWCKQAISCKVDLTDHMLLEKKQHTLTSALAMASRKTHFSMYPQADAHAWHVPHVAAEEIASK